MSGENDGGSNSYSTADDLRDRLESAHAEELALLGSSDFLAAASGGEVTATALLDAAAESERAARATFTEWAADAADDDARAAFESVVAQEAEHRERVAAELTEWTPRGGPPGPMHAYLRGRESTIERVAGGMVGRPLVSLRTHARLVDFFGRRRAKAAARRESLFSDLRTETAGALDDGLQLLSARCETERDWETAELVAGYTIRLAYDDTADALRSLGIDPNATARDESD
ncbi:rubrerythrin family protein [Halobellus captivus]|uniref:rubrerythrin family protein n=1 Tax=Halobellus captivus TaxID=2592614 RepID=UPI0011A042F7|nr:rubrerythrin family protein [Halobellus captivus]